ncbi:hypothetical protein GCM10007877_27400 [Marinibactrum halimedae]|uniref:Conjugal transfer protein TraF n=2 Tax=Marinibactrum halimedae TaxID=1444977 RepID=A0AA37WPA3_9GAMM|nr:hypothetical protein GCM10007877_27400 [Marinibactrum halimedae]
MAPAFVLSSVNVVAQGYGIYDARGLGMGGTATAIGSTDNGLFYNPALLALHDGDEDKTRDGRIYFPVITAEISRSVFDAVDIEEDELDERLTDSVNEFNNSQTINNALAVVDSADELLRAISELNDESLFANGFSGLSITEPGDREGGGFYIGARVIGGAFPDVTEEDLALLEDYTEALLFVGSSGEEGVAHPELFNADGSLIDPTDSLTSTATAAGLAIAEVGVSFAKEYNLFGHPIAVGVTPKFMILRTFDAQLDLDTGNIDSDVSDENLRALNFDFGMATEFADYYRFGLSVKDVISKDFDSETGQTVTLEPKTRMGLGYVRNTWQVGMDVDVTKVDIIGTNLSTQDLSLGGEWNVWGPVFLRGGYRYDIEETRDDIYSLGVGLQFRRFVFDFAASDGNGARGVSLQMGYVM